VAVDDHRGDVYFKATCPLFHSEPAITELLARVVPDHVPDLLVVDRERALMLMGALPGEDPDARHPEVAPAASRVISRTQIAMTDHLAELRAAGVPDRTLEPTLEDLAMLVSDSVELDQLTVEERERVRGAEPWLGQQLRALSDCGLPYTISHGDLHLGNVAEGDGRLVIYDWTDAAISFPSLDAVLLARSSTEAYRDETLAGYAEEWRRAFGELDFDAIWQASSIVTKVYQAISYERIYRAQEPRSRWELGGAVAGQLRDLGSRWAERQGR
jgi:aminoglycoside phosphotransferase (APT) family kinase protein